MNQRHTHPTLPPLLVAVVLVAFGLSGLMTGVLAHGFAASLAPTPVPTAHSTGTHPPEQPTHAATATPAAVVPTVRFTLTLAAQPQHISPGETLTLVASAASQSTGSPIANLRCTLGISRNGGVPLLSTWPAPALTNAQGHVTWHVTAPARPGTYTVAVSANGSNQYVAWAYATVYVSG